MESVSAVQVMSLENERQRSPHFQQNRGCFVEAHLQCGLTKMHNHCSDSRFCLAFARPTVIILSFTFVFCFFLILVSVENDVAAIVAFFKHQNWHEVQVIAILRAAQQMSP